jgi:soluble lytic murein transglycosylase-like protein
MPSEGYRDDGGTSVVPALLSATESSDAALRLDLASLTSDSAVPDSASPMWPVYRFLLAEVHLLRGDSAAAYRSYTGAAASALGDTAGNTGIALGAVSLLRSALLLRAVGEPEADRVGYLVRLAKPLLAHPLSPGPLEIPVLGGFPHLWETLLEELALLAWSAGERDTAARVFWKYLEVASAAELGNDGPALVEHLISQGIASKGEIDLLRGKRLYALRKFDGAGRFLGEALTCGMPEIRAGAGYYLARTRSVQGAPRKEIIALLTAALQETDNTGLIQEILLYRASVFSRIGTTRNTELALEDLAQIVERFPAGELADDALFELAKHYERERDVEKALTHLARLRGHQGPNDWMESAYFRAALIHYARDSAGDTEEAAGLLQELNRINPTGDLGLASLFWLGRIAAERGDTVSARTHFERVIEICPYDYYAIRARMHLSMGGRAAEAIRPEGSVLLRLRNAYLADSAALTEPHYSPIHSRLGEALESGLYPEVLGVSESLRVALPPKYPNELTLQDLEGAGAFAVKSILLSLRQDALDAASRAGPTRGSLSVAASVGRTARDWPLAMLLVFGLDRSVITQSKMQQQPAYLRAAYPPAYNELIGTAAAKYDVPAELLYSVMRRESLFYPEALSRVGAFGLFQFIPSTFETLDKRWNLLSGSGVSSREAFLSDPRLTIDLGARWFSEELMKRHEGNVLLAIMEHNAGYPAVKGWIESWEDSGHDRDVEYMIETAGFRETRIFTRSVLADMAVAQAIGLFAAEDSPPQKD